MKNNYLEKLNENQYLAVTQNLTSTLVVAGAGSGKTAVLVYRIAYLISELGINPKKILAFTFTNKAANEMKVRINNIIHDISLSYIGTFHSICLRILREDIHVLNKSNNFSIIDEEDQLSIVREIYAKYGIDKSILSYQNCLNNISLLKSHDVLVEEALEELSSIFEDDYDNKKKYLINNVYKEYLEYLQKNNLLDFDDLIKYAKKILSEHPNVLNKWRNRIDYILVDEFQDTNPDQYELIKLLSKDKNNVFAVGDPDQMIYSWRGAYKEIFDDFRTYFENVTTIILDKNYRSTKNILTVSNKLISFNKNRIKKDLYTDNNTGEKIVYRYFQNQDNESKWVVKKIQEITRKGIKYKDIAILYRSNYLSRNIEQELVRANIPYFIYGGFKFFQRKEIKDAIAYLKLISNNDDVSLSRIYNNPKRKISESTFTKIKEYAYKQDISIFEAFNHLDEIDISKQAYNSCVNFRDMILEFRNKKYNCLTEMLDHVLAKTGYKQMLLDNQEENRIENLEELKNALNQYEFKNPNSTIEEYLQEVSLFTTLDEENKNNNDCVSLMTVHLSKGLEFKIVFIIEFNEGIFPSYKSIETHNIDEERRIAYVAMTRAKQDLYISASGGVNFVGNSKEEKLPSRFIKDIKDSPELESSKETFTALYENKSEMFYNSQRKDYSEYFHDKEIDWQIGDVVVHSTFGSGVIVDIKSTYLDIVFKHPYGQKSITKNHKSLVRKLN